VGGIDKPHGRRAFEADERDVYCSGQAFGKCAKAAALSLVACWKPTNITAFDMGETDEKNVWFVSGKSVGIHSGDIPGSDDVRVQ